MKDKRGRDITKFREAAKATQFKTIYNWDEINKVFDNMIKEEWSRDDVLFYAHKTWKMPISTATVNYYKRVKKTSY